MKCWSCNGGKMNLKPDGSFYECDDCGATENIGGASDTEHTSRVKKTGRVTVKELIDA